MLSVLQAYVFLQGCVSGSAQCSGYALFGYAMW